MDKSFWHLSPGLYRLCPVFNPLSQRIQGPKMSLRPAFPISPLGFPCFVSTNLPLLRPPMCSPQQHMVGVMLPSPSLPLVMAHFFSCHLSTPQLEQDVDSLAVVAQPRMRTAPKLLLPTYFLGFPKFLCLKRNLRVSSSWLIALIFHLILKGLQVVQEEKKGFMLFSRSLKIINII